MKARDVFAAAPGRRNGQGVAPILTLALTALFVLALLPAAASAGQIHVLSSSFGEAGSAVGKFSLAEHSGIAADEETGKVYVADTGNGRVQRFAADGSSPEAFATGLTSPTFLAVDNSPTSAAQGDVYVADTATNEVLKYEANGTFVETIDASVTGPGSFGEIAGIAVDSSGVLYVLRNDFPAPLFKFDSDGNFIGELALEEFGTASASIAVAPDGSIFKVRGNGFVAQYSSTGAVLNGQIVTCVAGPCGGIAADLANGDLYAADGGEVIRVNSAGIELERFGSGDIGAAAGPAVNGSDGTAYVADQAKSEVEVFEAVLVPTVATEPASGITGEAATLHGTVSADGGPSATCAFQYVTQAHFEAEGFTAAEEAPCEPAGPFTGSGAEAVSAEIAGLSPDTAYRFRLVGSNEKGDNFGTALSLETVGLPSVETMLAFDKTPESAELRGEIDPNLGSSGLAATYRFEYGTDTSYGHLTPDLQTSEVIGPGQPRLIVSAQIAGLAPSTTYHFRLVAENVAGPAVPGRDRAFVAPSGEGPRSDCPNQARRSEDLSRLLPDCRAYELVSPPGNGKEGGDVMLDNSRAQAAADGSAVSFASLRSFGDSTGTGTGAEFISERSPSPEPGDNGWSTHSISPHQRVGSLATATQGLEPFYVGELSADLGKGVFSALSPLTDEPLVAEAVNLYTRTDLRSPGAGSYLLDTACPLCAQSEEPLLPMVEFFGKPTFVGASADFSHVVYESNRRLTADSAASHPLPFNLYQSINGQVSLVGLIPPPGETECGPSGPACVPAVSSVAAHHAWESRYSPHVVSADGSRVFFMDDSTTGLDKSGNLYARIDNQRTVQINVSEVNPAEAPQPAEYEDATPDGSKVYFKTAQTLLSADEDGGEADLYQWEADAPAGSRLTLVSFGTPAYVEGIIGTSGDGSYVYFLANSGGSSATPEVYLRHSGATVRIGAVSFADISHDSPRRGTEWNLNPLQSRVSPAGHKLLFSAGSGARLSGYETAAQCDGNFGAGGGSCRVLYLYDAEADRLQCVSCNPDGSPARDNSLVKADVARGGALTSSRLPHALSANGRYVFFSTKAALVPGDTNGAVDAYEYDSLSEEDHLLSSGTDEKGSYFMDASANGKDVFIATAQQLSRWDVDGSYDLYDVRVDGGFPEPPAATAPCKGDSCRVASAQAPPAPGAASASFSGPGNPKPKRCPKGRHAVKVRGKTRCLKARHHKKHDSHKRKSHQRAAKDNRRAGR